MSMLKDAFTKLKDYLPDLEIRDKVQKILQECDIVTQTEMNQQLKQLEQMRQRLHILETRIAELEKASAKTPQSD